MGMGMGMAMRIIGLLARRIGYAVTCVALCAGGVAAALWCAQAVRSVPDGAASPARSSVDDEEPGGSPADGESSDAGALSADLSATVEPGIAPEDYRRHVTEVEENGDSAVVHTDLTGTSADQRSALGIAVMYVRERAGDCVDVQDIGQVSVVSRDGAYLSGLPETFSILTTGDC
jgi:hypothetical protein